MKRQYISTAFPEPSSIKPAIVALSLLALLSSGCSDKNPNKPATQVVAKVNGDEISIHQVNNALAQMPTVAPEHLAAVRREVLDKLINQQMAVQQAISLKLDRSPDVMMQLDAARREILTRAYLKKLVVDQARPTDDEAKKFYSEHPQLFADRRIYSLQEISLAAGSISLTDLQKLVDGRSMAEIADQLKQRAIPFGANTGTRAAEQIQLPMLNKLAELQDGQTSIIQTAQTMTVLHLTLSQRSPMKEEVALQQIPKYLMNERSKTMINAQLDHLKQQAKITYLNEFSGPVAQAPAAPAVPELSSPIAEKSIPVSTIEKGIAGIN